MQEITQLTTSKKKIVKESVIKDYKLYSLKSICLDFAAFLIAIYATY